MARISMKNSTHVIGLTEDSKFYKFDFFMFSKPVRHWWIHIPKKSVEFSEWYKVQMDGNKPTYRERVSYSWEAIGYLTLEWAIDWILYNYQNQGKSYFNAVDFHLKLQRSILAGIYRRSNGEEKYPPKKLIGYDEKPPRAMKNFLRIEYYGGRTSIDKDGWRDPDKMRAKFFKSSKEGTPFDTAQSPIIALIREITGNNADIFDEASESAVLI